MGDRCTLTLNYRKRDEAKVLKAFDCDPSDASEDDGVVNATFFETNYGGVNELTSLADAGVKFYGSHDEGGTYGSSVFASMNTGTIHDVECSHNGLPVVEIREDNLQPDSGQLKRAQEFFHVERKVKAFFARTAKKGG